MCKIGKKITEMEKIQIKLHNQSCVLSKVFSPPTCDVKVYLSSVSLQKCLNFKLMEIFEYYLNFNH